MCLSLREEGLHTDKAVRVPHSCVLFRSFSGQQAFWTAQPARSLALLPSSLPLPSPLGAPGWQQDDLVKQTSSDFVT